MKGSGRFTLWHLGVFALIVLFVFTCFNHFETQLFYTDEAQHLANIQLIATEGLSENFLLKYTCTPGPVYAVIQYALSPLTQQNLAAMRLINIVFLIGSIFFIWKIAQKIWPGYEVKTAPFTLLFVPITYIAAGLALTEFCAIFFALSALFTLLKAFETPENSLKAGYAIISGLLLGFSAATRQPFIVLVPGIFLLWYDYNSKSNLLMSIVAAGVSLLLPLYIYGVWGDWVAPYFQASIRERSWAPEYGVLAFAFAGIFMLFISPGWFDLRWSRREWIVRSFIFAAITFLNYNFKWLVHLPNKALAWKFGLELQTFIAILFGAFAIGMCLLFIEQLIRNWFKYRQLPGITYLYAVIFLLLLSCVKNTYIFGSRYVLITVPFLILASVPGFSESRSRILVCAFGAILGFVSLVLTLQV